MAVRAANRRHGAVRGIFDRAVEMGTHSKRSLDDLVHIWYVEAKQRRVSGRNGGGGGGG